MTHLFKTILATLAAAALAGCSSAPDETDTVSFYDLSDSERFKLVSEVSQMRQYIAIKERKKNKKGEVTVAVQTDEAVITSNRRYFDKGQAINQYCIEELRILDGFETDDAGYTFPVYTVSQDIVECPEWKLYKELFAPHFENAKSTDSPTTNDEVN
ncbi:hypothetical protein OCT63_20790 [Vibrio sp. RW]|uniref:hypothetical protein n=1 Tax=Vibrio sp. RW TaxID=2998833 RepID=UPI0022CD5748|nr:hypothetical protein [Vibrio sp. RW]MDA0146652.1 hypothetical protein [Vibrio sp. RW]